MTVEHADADADVLFVTNAWPVPGWSRYGIFTKRQVESLVGAGLHCDVLFVHGFESPLAYLLAAVTLLRLNLLRQPRYRVVHAHGGETLLPCLLFLRGHRVVSFLGSDLLGAPDADGRISASQLVTRRLLRTLARLTSATITKSRAMQDVLPPPVRRRNTVLPNGVDRELFRPMDRAHARRALDWPATEPVALFAADPASPQKRYGLAVAACDHARANGVPVRLRVADTVAPSLMPLVMNAADCLLLTSAVEGSPNVVKEALAVGLPVVATPVGDVRELMAGVHPSYVCAADPAVLGAAVAACVRAGMRSNGRERSEWLDHRRIAERLMALYASLT